LATIDPWSLMPRALFKVYPAAWRDQPVEVAEPSVAVEECVQRARDIDLELADDVVAIIQRVPVAELGPDRAEVAVAPQEGAGEIVAVGVAGDVAAVVDRLRGADLRRAVPERAEVPHPALRIP
jgi:hypothetical protein